VGRVECEYEQEARERRERTDQSKTKSLSARNGLAHHVRFADMKKDLGSELNLVRLGKKEAVL
jgi:hypothetical protein